MKIDKEMWETVQDAFCTHDLMNDIFETFKDDERFQLLVLDYWTDFAEGVEENQ